MWDCSFLDWLCNLQGIFSSKQEGGEMKIVVNLCKSDFKELIEKFGINWVKRGIQDAHDEMLSQCDLESIIENLKQQENQ